MPLEKQREASFPKDNITNEEIFDIDFTTNKFTEVANILYDKIINNFILEIENHYDNEACNKIKMNLFDNFKKYTNEEGIYKYLNRIL